MNDQPPVPEENTTKPLISNELYDKLKPIVMVVLPAAATLWLALANVWNWPNAEEVGFTITAIAAFFGLVLRASSKRYEESDAGVDGYITVVEDPETGLRTAGMKLTNYEDPADVVQQDKVTFRVVGR